MKVIFLDVDGVLNSQQLFEKCEDDQLISVDEDNIKNLKTIVDATGAKIILEIRMGRTQ
jgi:histidinol phosphatase-like enzyme